MGTVPPKGTDSPSEAGSFDQIGLSVEQAAKALSCSKSLVYQKIYGGELKAKKLGARVIILRSSLLEFIEGQPDVWTSKENI